MTVIEQSHLHRIPSGLELRPVPFSRLEVVEAETQFDRERGIGGVFVRIDEKAELILLLRAFPLPAVVPIEAPALDALARRGQGEAFDLHG